MLFNFDIFQFSLLYVFLIVLLLIMIIYSRAPYWLKTIPIIISIFFLIGSYLTIDGLLGRPTKLSLPAEFVYLWHVAEAPIKAKDDPGRIIVFLKDEIGYRLHEIVYSRDAQKKLNKAKRQSNGGKNKTKIITKEKKRDKKGRVTNRIPYPPVKWKILNDRVNLPPK